MTRFPAPAILASPGLPPDSTEASAANEERFRHDINRLRGVAIVLVVVSHTMALSKGTQAGEAILLAIRGATWPFLFIAGFLLAHLAHRYDFSSYIAGKLRTVVVPYVVIVSLIVVASLNRYDVPLWEIYLSGYAASAPLWFVPLLCVFYLGFPFYSRLIKYPRTLLFTATIALLFTALYTRPGTEEGFLQNFAYFQSAYLSGMAWRVHQERFDRAVRAIYPILLVAVVAAAASQLDIIHQIFVIAPLTALLLPALQSDNRLNWVWEWLAPRSFGIYFLHGVVTDRLPLWLDVPVNPLVSLLLGLALTIACGFMVSAVQAVAGRRSRYFVGA